MNQDIRARLGIDLDNDIAYQIVRDIARALDARRLLLVRGCCASCEESSRAAAQAPVAEGVQVPDLGLCVTKGMYFVTSHFGADGGICVPASNNRRVTGCERYK